ncbi:MAG: WD40/YVTN/BNR-like repeat-containing protein [Acidimicrobiales bacterium]
MTVDELVREALEAEVADVELDPHAWERLRGDLEGRPRRRWQPLTVVLAAAAVLVLVVAAAALLGGQEDDTVVVAPSTTAAPTTAEDDTDAAAIPADFRAASSTWISPDEGWVLGTATCDDVPCAVVARTTDGGASWQQTGDPPFELIPGTDDEVRIRFANPDDGWIFGGGLGLLATHNRGRSWTPVTDPQPATVFALDAGDDVAWALIAPGGDLEAGRTEAPRLYASAIGTDDWQQAAGNVNSGSLNPELHSLTVDGSIAFVAGTMPDPWVFVNRADGTDDNLELPTECGRGPRLGAGAGVLLAVCPTDAAAGSVGKLTFLSTNGGASWQPRGDAPLPGSEITGVAAADESTFAIAARSGATFIHMSFDGGATWETPVELADGGAGLLDFRFVTPEVGVAVSGDGQLYRTTDGGHTWAPVRID